MSYDVVKDRGFFKTLVTCTCPPSPAEMPISRTPLDRYGFHARCCKCIPLKAAVILICIASFIWVTLEMVSLDKYVARLFPDKDEAFQAFKIFYMVLVILFALICSVFMIGIITEKYLTVTVFIWCALFFNLIFIIIYISGVIMSIINDKFSKRLGFKIVLAVAWNCLYFYFLMIVNSYRLLLWVNG